jgi:hypothetical protein
MVYYELLFKLATASAKPCTLSPAEAINCKLNEVGILTHLSKLKRLGRRRQALSSILGDRLVNDSTTVHAFPRIKHQKKIRESLHPHQALAFGTLHRAPLSG